MDEHQAEYADTPAAQIEALCVACGGEGARMVERAGVFAVGQMAEISGGRMVSVGRHEACPVCPHAAPGVPSGRVNLATGPGSGHLRRVDRVAMPNDGWG
jgi:hypothetical protein